MLCFAQGNAKLLQKAEEAYTALAYAQAIEQYELFLQKPKSIEVEILNKAQLHLANSYFFVKDFTKAEKNYTEVLSRNILLKGEDIKAYLRYAQILASNGKHAESKLAYQRYNDLQEQDKRGMEFIKLYSNLDALTRNASSYRIEYIGINTSNADFSPTYYKKGFVFVSGREKNTSIKRMFSWDNTSFLDLFFLEDLKKVGGQSASASVSSSATSAGLTPNQSKRKLGSDYYTPSTSNDATTIATQGSDYISGSTDYYEEASISTKWFSKGINTKYHEGPCSFFHNEDKVVFTRNGQNITGVLGKKTDGINRLKLYVADKRGNDWGNITEFPYNSSDYSCGHPTITIDDKILYFVSDMPGGYGGTDIYMSYYSKGQWSKPVNLGGSINSQGNEMFPYVDERGNLYFATDGHPGLGGLDMFFMAMNTATGMPAGKARNLGAPLNSTQDDFGIITDSERSFGFFSSNRKRGGSDDDIYRFDRFGTLYGCRELIVTVYDNSTKKPIGQNRFQYMLKADTTNRESAITNIQGTIKLCLIADEEFVFNFEQEGYQPVKKTFSNLDASDYEPSQIDIYLKPIVVEEKKPLAKRNQGAVVHQREKSISKIFKGTITSGESGKPLAGVRLKFINLCTGISQEIITKKDGMYEFERDINCDYELLASSDEFASSREIIEKIEEKKTIPVVALFKKKEKKTNIPNYSGSLFDTKLYRVGDVVKLENIYYESSSWELTKPASRELDRLAATLKRYPNMIVEIRSHTDTRGNAQENLGLSQKRAEQVVSYLSKKGIEKRRMKAIGMGESHPLNKCGDGVQCTEAEHQRNRRTEFKILQIEKLF